MTEKGIVEVFTAADFKCVHADAKNWSHYYPPEERLQDFADTANRILSVRSIPVKAYALKDSGIVSEHGAGWVASEESVRTDAPRYTHTALLVNVRPIAKDTAESLLAEMRETHAIPPQYVERARKVLGAE